ncbi:hypothetical protein D3C78_1113670 [compost metagenome]
MAFGGLQRFQAAAVEHDRQRLVDAVAAFHCLGFPARGQRTVGGEIDACFGGQAVQALGQRAGGNVVILRAHLGLFGGMQRAAGQRGAEREGQAQAELTQGRAG